MAKQTFKAVYKQPRTFFQYDQGRIILYPHETVIENYIPEKKEGQEETPEPYTGYQYEGEEADGGFIRECADPTDIHDVANAIIRTRYTYSEELALQRHYMQEPEAYKDKWQAYYDFANQSAEKARRWLGIGA